MISIFRELLAKEFHLQRTNAMFAMAVLLLGITGLLIVTGAGPEIAGFSTNEIRTGLFMVVLLPILVCILPLMVGSTAAAAEKPMEVWAWQGALPVSWRRVVCVKIIVVMLACVILSGVLPFILERFVPENEDALFRLFRGTWPGWLGLLCGAIGFYSGSLTRDDYQGLLVSIIPVALVCWFSWMTDPFLLAAPVGKTEVIWKEWAMALRLMVIGAFFLVLAGSLLRRSGQPRRLQVARHAAIVLPLVVCLTLWNVVTERSVLVTDQRQQNDILSTPYLGVPHQLIPTPMARVEPVNRFGSLYSGISVLGSGRHGQTFAAAGIITGDSKWLDKRYVNGPVTVGVIARDSKSLLKHYNQKASTHYFLYTKEKPVTEFSQAPNGTLEGYTKDLSWILTKHKDGVEALSGPWGITISSLIMPDVYFTHIKKCLNLIDIPQDIAVHGSHTSGTLSLPGKDDLVVQILDYGRVLLENGKKDIPSDKQSQILLRLFPRENSDAAYATFMDFRSGTMTALFRSTGKSDTYRLAGWTSGLLTQKSEDMTWVKTESKNGSFSINQLGNFAQVSAGATTESVAPRQWQISSSSTTDDGSTLTVVSGFVTLPKVTIGQKNYTWFSYRKTGPVTLGGRIADKSFPYEQGILVLDLETGNQSLLPVRLPWPPEGSVKLQTEVTGPKYAFQWPNFITDNKSDTIAASLGDWVGLFSIKESILENRVDLNYIYIPHFTEGAFTAESSFMATDGSNVWLAEQWIGGQRSYPNRQM